MVFLCLCSCPWRIDALGFGLSSPILFMYSYIDLRVTFLNPHASRFLEIYVQNRACVKVFTLFLRPLYKEVAESWSVVVRSCLIFLPYIS